MCRVTKLSRLLVEAQKELRVTQARMTETQAAMRLAEPEEYRQMIDALVQFQDTENQIRCHIAVLQREIANGSANDSFHY